MKILTEAVNKKILSIQYKNLPAGIFAFSLILVFLLWFMHISAENLDHNIRSVFLIHKIPIIWLIDTIPFIALFSSIVFIKKIEKIKDEFAFELLKKEELLKKYSGIARKMGQGDFALPVAENGSNDELGKSLEKLRTFLIANEKKENNLIWIAEGKDMISRILRTHNSLEDLSREVLKNLIGYIEVMQGAFHYYHEEEQVLRCVSTYSYNNYRSIGQEFKPGEGLPGKCVKEMDYIYIREIPDDYYSISSGILGNVKPAIILVVPLIVDEKLQGVLEFSSLYSKIPRLSIQFLLELGEIIGRSLLNLRYNLERERLLKERLRAEKEERLKTRMQSLSENSPDLILRISLSGQFFYVNPVVEKYAGICNDKIVNKLLSEVEMNSSLQEYLERVIANIKIYNEKISEELEIPVMIGDKLTEKILSIDAIPEFNDGEQATILIVGHDVTESRRIEKEIQEKNKNIEDSINYAKKIQTALLPETDNIRNHLPYSFVYYQPKDVISGDFPWFYNDGKNLFIAAVDCTGHGVPGALLSFVAFFLMKNIIDRHADKDPGKICDILHEQFRETLKQNNNNSGSGDGLDLALCKIKKDFASMQFAGARRPLYLLRETELIEFRGDRKSIGGIPFLKRKEEAFTSYNIPLHPGDKIFFFSDGITDQLGGPYGRKYTPTRMKDKITENPGLTMMEYHQLFSNEFNNWQKGFKQLDDVLVIGIEF